MKRCLYYQTSDQLGSRNRPGVWYPQHCREIWIEVGPFATAEECREDAAKEALIAEYIKSGGAMAVGTELTIYVSESKDKIGQPFVLTLDNRPGVRLRPSRSTWEVRTPTREEFQEAEAVGGFC